MIFLESECDFSGVRREAGVGQELSSGRDECTLTPHAFWHNSLLSRYLWKTQHLLGLLPKVGSH